jgi:glycosyltransferase involved in cell wall biosynthesis
LTGRPAVNVVGYLRSESGVGQASRAVVAGLDVAGAVVLPIHPHDVPPSRQGVPFATVAPERAAFAVNLLCLTAFETPGFAASVSPSFFRGRHTIGLWWWEVELFPEIMHAGFASVDEVWVASEHVARALRAAAGAIPVTIVRVPVVRPAPTRLTRAQLGLPEGHLFLTTFGYYSSVVRKNPMAVIAAFAQAFAPGDGPALVVKCIDHEAHPEEHARIQALAGEHPDVHLMPGYVDEAAMAALLHHAETVVSLHRAEGFGFVPAQAMAIGKPVIATRYSGNLDYMRDDNAFLVDAELRAIGPEGAPYPAEGVWAEPDVEQAAALMRRVVEDPGEARRRGAQAERDISARYSPAAAGATMTSRLAALGVRQPPALRARITAARLARRRAAASDAARRGRCDC